ncbi:PKD domain-containing protein, partial [Thermoplasmatota archaeon]
INTILSWTCIDPDGDTLTYDVYFGTTNPPTKITSNQSGTNYDPNLNYDTTYYWMIIAWDLYNESNTSEIWSFTTQQSTGGGGNGGDPEEPPTENENPVAHASASDTNAFIGESINFDGSNSYDNDGNITSYSWNFGDGSSASGKTASHSYSSNGTYNVILTVTDNNGSSDSDSITIVVSKANNPPSKPTINGPAIGFNDTSYGFTASSSDADGDNIQYIFNWGDGETTTTGFIANGTSAHQTHSWASYGEFKISVKAYDGATESGASTHTIIISELLPIDENDTGYLIDEDGDGIYDSYYNKNSGRKTTIVQYNNTTYIFDIDGDDKWDLIYDTKTGLKTEFYEYIEPKLTPGFELLYLLTLLAIFLIILRKRRKK